MRFLGARVVLTPASEKGTGMVEKARELAAAHGWFWTRQFENEANADVHIRTTAREILRDFGEAGLDYFVTGAGTGGTLKGVARVLRAESPVYRPWILRHPIAIKRPSASCPSCRVGTGPGSDGRAARSASFRCRSA
jgi:cysteine synthase A